MVKLIVDTDDLLTTTEAAKELGVAYCTIYRWIETKKVTPVRLGNRTLISKAEIERLKEERANEGK